MKKPQFSYESPVTWENRCFTLQTLHGVITNLRNVKLKQHIEAKTIRSILLSLWEEHLLRELWAPQSVKLEGKGATKRVGNMHL